MVVAKHNSQPLPCSPADIEVRQTLTPSLKKYHKRYALVLSRLPSPIPVRLLTIQRRVAKGLTSMADNVVGSSRSDGISGAQQVPNNSGLVFDHSNVPLEWHNFGGQLSKLTASAFSHHGNVNRAGSAVDVPLHVAPTTGMATDRLSLNVKNSRVQCNGQASFAMYTSAQRRRCGSPASLHCPECLA